MTNENNKTQSWDVCPKTDESIKNWGFTGGNWSKELSFKRVQFRGRLHEIESWPRWENNLKLVFLSFFSCPETRRLQKRIKAWSHQNQIAFFLILVRWHFIENIQIILFCGNVVFPFLLALSKKNKLDSLLDFLIWLL